MSKITPGKFSRVSVTNKTQKNEEAAWMGNITSPAMTERNQLIVEVPEKAQVSSFMKKQSSVKEGQAFKHLQFNQTSVVRKSAAELIETVLFKLSENPIDVNPYFNKKTVGKAIDVLKNRSRLNNYITDLKSSAQKQKANLKVSFQVLALLLQKMSDSWNGMQIQINDDETDFDISFNSRTVEQKDEQIDDLRKELSKLQDQSRELEATYLQTISNLSESIANLSK